MDLFNHIDSIAINFHKSMLVGMPGSLFYIENRKLFTKFFEPDLEFGILKNVGPQNNEAINYKDWSFGFGRRFNSLKFFYLFRFYGLKNLQEFIRSTVNKRNYVVDKIEKSGVLKLFSEPKFGLVCFQLCNKDGEVDNKLTEVLG